MDQTQRAGARGLGDSLPGLLDAESNLIRYSLNQLGNHVASASVP